jgi:hypothetical protein
MRKNRQKVGFKCRKSNLVRRISYRSVEPLFMARLIYGFIEPLYGTVWNACILFTLEGELFSIRERLLPSVKLVRVARVGAAARRELITPERTGQSWGATPPDLGALPEPLAPASGEGKDAGAPAEADAVGGSPSAAPKRHEVGRVARRARPEMSCHKANIFCVPRLTLKAGRKAGSIPCLMRRVLYLSGHTSAVWRVYWNILQGRSSPFFRLC